MGVLDRSRAFGFGRSAECHRDNMKLAPEHQARMIAVPTGSPLATSSAAVAPNTADAHVFLITGLSINLYMQSLYNIFIKNTSR